MKTTLYQIARLLYYTWFCVPYLLFLTIGCFIIYTEIALGGMSWKNDAYEMFSPIVILLVPTVIGLLLLPFIALFVFIFRRRYSKKLFYASAGYFLYLVLFFIAGTMGWYVD